MTSEGRQKKLQIVVGVLLIIWTIGCISGSSYLYQKGIAVSCKMAMIGALFGGSILYAIIDAKIGQQFLNGQEKHIGRFCLICGICVLITCFLPLLPYLGWIFPAMALVLILFSNVLIGMGITGFLLAYAIFLAEAPIYVWILFFSVSLVTALLFEHLDTKYETGFRTFITMLLYTVVLLGCVVFQDKEELLIEDFMIPIIGLFANYVLIAVVLRSYSVLVIHKLKDHYDVINDQEYDLIKKYKTEKEVYLNAIHTAYFCEKIARVLHMNVELAKAGGYYHKIAELAATQENRTLEEICNEYNFPDELMQLLIEYTDKAKPICLKEATLLYFADNIVSSVRYILQKDTKAEPDYPQIIHAIFKRKEESGILNQSDVSLKELHVMEQIFTGEKLYYDFLR